MDTKKENRKGTDDCADAELAGLEDVDVMDIGFERVKDASDRVVLTPIKVLAKTNAAVIFGIDETAIQEGTKCLLGCLPFSLVPTCHTSKLV